MAGGYLLRVSTNMICPQYYYSMFVNPQYPIIFCKEKAAALFWVAFTQFVWVSFILWFAYGVWLSLVYRLTF